MHLNFNRLWATGLLRRVCHFALCAFWIGLAMVSIWLAAEAYSSLATKIPRTGFRIPVAQSVQRGTASFQQVINTMAERCDQTASDVEESIRRVAGRSLWLNLTSAFLSLIGFAIQLWSAQRETVDRKSEQIWAAVHNSAAPKAEPQPEAEGEPAPELHEGSFPDGAYGH